MEVSELRTMDPRMIRVIEAIGTEVISRRGICGNMEVRARKNLWDLYTLSIVFGTWMFLTGRFFSFKYFVILFAVEAVSSPPIVTSSSTLFLMKKSGLNSLSFGL